MSIFALIAAAIFFLRAFGVTIGSVDMLLLALGFLALHFAYEWSIPIRRGM
jgi:hypothetical protein